MRRGLHEPIIIGIYAIYNRLTGKSYIGSSKDILNRIPQHFYELSKGTHHSRKLQNSYNKYGKEVFEYQILYIVDCIDVIFDIEQSFIDKFDVYKSGYNCTSKAGHWRGLDKHTEESKYRMKLAQIKASEKKRAAMIGRKIAKPINNKKSIPIVQLSLVGEFIKEFPSSAEIGRTYGDGYLATRCCKKKTVTAYGFKWVYAKDYYDTITSEGEWIDDKHYRKPMTGLHMKGRTFSEESKKKKSESLIENWKTQIIRNRNCKN